jgi:serine/threonine protein phosphatase 1
MTSWIKRPRVPDGLRIYAVGDVHGCIDLLDGLLARIDAHLAAHPAVASFEIYLGDYIDRGLASKQVIDRLIARAQVRDTICLRGNHETFATGFLKRPVLLNEWRQYGGLQTLLSYGLVPSRNLNSTEQTRLAAAFDHALPDNHRRFLEDLKFSFVCGDFFFVHAGIRPGIPLAKQRARDLLWIREDFLQCEDTFSKIIVHGHTPVQEPDIRHNRINIDTGAYATGRLTCLMLEDDKLEFI